MLGIKKLFRTTNSNNDYGIKETNNHGKTIDMDLCVSYKLKGVTHTGYIPYKEVEKTFNKGLKQIRCYEPLERKAQKKTNSNS